MPSHSCTPPPLRLLQSPQLFQIISRFNQNAKLEFMTQLSYKQLCSKEAPSTTLQAQSLLDDEAASYFDIPVIWMALTSWREESCSNGEVPEWGQGDLGKLSACFCSSYLRNDPSKCSFRQKVPLCWTNLAYCIFSLRRELKQNGNINELMQFLLPQILIYRKDFWNQNIAMILI